MDEKKKHHNYKSHPYLPTHNHYQNNSRSSFIHNQPQKKNWKKYEIVDELNGKITIHPSSIYDEPFPKFQQPVEIGIILSESNNKYSFKILIFERIFKFT